MTDAQFINDIGSTLATAGIILFGVWMCFGGHLTIARWLKNIKDFITGAPVDEYDENGDYIGRK